MSIVLILSYYLSLPLIEATTKNAVLQDALNDIADASTPMDSRNVALFKTITKSEKDLNINPDKRIDLFGFNVEVS